MVYLNNAAGTKPYPEVIKTITDVLANNWANPHDSTSFGYKAQQIINNVTEQVANDINCSTEEIVWTSGACEANSLAIMGLLNNNPNMHFYTTFLEHASINEMVKSLPNNRVGFISNDKSGRISIEGLENALIWNYTHHIKPLVSVSYANSEIGVVQDIQRIARLVHLYDGILHVDATQVYGWMKKLDVQLLDIDLMSVSGQKIHGPKGVGFLYVRKGIELKPLIYGSQQNGLRGGTMPTHLIAAFGKALELTRIDNTTERVMKLRNKMQERLLKIEGVHSNGPEPLYKLPNIISLTIDGVKAETLVTMCDLVDKVIIGKGSACQSYKPKPSQTLLSIGLTEEQALSTIRISLDEFTIEKDMDRAVDIIEQLIPQIRKK